MKLPKPLTYALLLIVGYVGVLSLLMPTWERAVGFLLSMAAVGVAAAIGVWFGDNIF